MKALGRAKEPTPANGKLIMRIEAKVAEYGADLPKLRSNVHDLAASKQIIKEAAAVRPATATSLLAPSPLHACAPARALPFRRSPHCGQHRVGSLMTMVLAACSAGFLHHPFSTARALRSWVRYEAYV